MKFFVSGLSGVETTLAVRGFPVTYYPVDYPFFGIKCGLAGSGYRVACGLKALGDEVEFLSFTGDDATAKRVFDGLAAAGIDCGMVYKTLADTVESVALQEVPFGRRQVYCDLKDAQEKYINAEDFRAAVERSDACVICNINYNRPLLHLSRSLGKKVFTDVQNLTDIYDEFNSEFIENADVLFLSDEGAPNAPRDFLYSLAGRCTAEIIVMGMAADGALCYERSSDRVFKTDAPNVGNVITAGAGGALLSGFAHFYGKYGAEDALIRASACAGLKLLANSSDGAFPTEEQVERFIISRM